MTHVAMCRQVPLFYESRVGKAVLNYGCSVGHIPARIASTDHAGDVAVSACASTPHLLGQCYCTASDTHNHRLTPEQYDTILSKLSQGLDEGGLGIGARNLVAPIRLCPLCSVLEICCTLSCFLYSYLAVLHVSRRKTWASTSV